MPRPPKDARHRMSTHLRIPVTDEQKRIIMDAIADESSGFAAWARAILLDAAKRKLARSKDTTAREANANS
jgi:hypothetical protein